jgi:hypothetical protein
MRTTVEFDDDTAKAIEQLMRDEGVGVSEAVNRLVRRGLLPTASRPALRQRTHRLGLRIDVSDLTEALDALEDADHR